MNSSRRPFSPLEKAFLSGASALLMLGVGWAAIQSRINDEPSLVFPKPVGTPSPNGFDLYLAAAKAIAPAKPPVDAIDDRENLLKTNPQLAAQNYSLARKQAWLRSNAAGFVLFQRGIATPTVHPSTRGSIMGDFKNNGPLRQLARAKMIETHAFVMQKNWPAAVSSSLDTIQMGSDIARGAPMTNKLVSSAIISLGRGALTDENALPEKLDAASARAAAQRLERILKNRSTFKAALQEERWVALSNFLTVSHDTKANWRNAKTYSDRATWRDQVATHIISKETVASQINRSFDLRIADMEQPWSAPDTPQPISNPIVRLFQASNFPRAQEARELVPLQILMLRLALRAYRLENGAFPDDLKSLAPKYLAKIPTDLYADGKPFHFRKTASDYELWSVGPDGKDDGATPIPWRDGKTGAKLGVFPPLLYLSRKFPAPSGDYVARRSG